MIMQCNVIWNAQAVKVHSFRLCIPYHRSNTRNKPNSHMYFSLLSLQLSTKEARKTKEPFWLYLLNLIITCYHSTLLTKLIQVLEKSVVVWGTVQWIRRRSWLHHHHHEEAVQMWNVRKLTINWRYSPRTKTYLQLFFFTFANSAITLPLPPPPYFFTKETSYRQNLCIFLA